MRRGRFYRFGFDFPFGFYFRREPFGFFGGPWGFPRREEYLRWLEEYKRDLEKYREELEEELKEVEKEIEELRRE